MEPLTNAEFGMRNSERRPVGLNRRAWLHWAAAVSGASWLTPVAQLLADEAERMPGHEPAQSLILLWLAGGPSQLETFDPQPGKSIAGGTQAIRTAVKGVQLAAGYERLAEQAPHFALVRSLVSKEGDHERGTYLVKTGYRPDPTVIHPSIGAICCHQLPVGATEIPRHISILPQQWPSVGGMLGKQFDAFKCDDPAAKTPDVTARVSDKRFHQRLEDLAVVERAFSRGRSQQVQATLHRATIESARKMMSSEQLQAFEIDREPLELRKAYGETPFGRGCLAARRLTEVGVRCVEVSLGGWDTHANNHEGHREQAKILDAALSALLEDLRSRDLLRKTIVLCGGEFGRTPQINRLGGRDHWPHGFSMLLAGGRIRGGTVLGATDPEGGRKVEAPRQVADLHATVLSALGIDPDHEELAPVGRPIKFSEGQLIKELLS